MLKTKKGVAKRFKVSKNGKVRYRPCGKQHLLSSKEPERLRKLRRAKTLQDKKKKRLIKKSLPYAF